MAFQKAPRQPAKQAPAQQVKKSNILVDFLLFPWKIQRAYSKQGRKIRRIIKIAEANKKQNIADDCKYRLRRQNYLTLLYIILPIWLGLGYSGVSFYIERKAVVQYAKGFRTALPSLPKTRPQIKAFVAKGGGFSQFKSRVKNLGRPPINPTNVLPSFAGYFISFFGALMISLNRAFSSQDKLRLVFIRRKMVDANGEPWEVCWTPTAILLETWDAKVDDLVDRKEIWNEVGFSPDCALKDPKKPSSIVLAESQDLPKEIKVIFKEARVAEAAKDRPKALEKAVSMFKKEMSDIQVEHAKMASPKPMLNEVLNDTPGESEENEKIRLMEQEEIENEEIDPEDEPVEDEYVDEIDDDHMDEIDEDEERDE